MKVRMDLCRNGVQATVNIVGGLGWPKMSVVNICDLEICFSMFVA